VTVLASNVHLGSYMLDLFIIMSIVTDRGDHLTLTTELCESLGSIKCWTTLGSSFLL